MRTLTLLVALSLSVGAYSFGQFSFGSGSSMSAPEDSGKGGGSGGGGRGSSSSPDLSSSPGFCSDDIKSQKGENSLEAFMNNMDALQYTAGKSYTYKVIRADIVVLHSGFCPISGDGGSGSQGPQGGSGPGGGDQPITPTVIPDPGGPSPEPPSECGCMECPCPP